MDKDTLISDMLGKDTIEKWDVMTSFDQAKLNEVLSQKYKDNILVSTVKCTFQYSDLLYGENISVDIDMKINEPVMEFIQGSESMCKLSMTIMSGEYRLSWTEDGESMTRKKKFPEGQVTLVCNVPIAAIHGSQNSQVSGSNTVINFMPEEKDSANFVLHFQNSDLMSSAVEAAGKGQGLPAPFSDPGFLNSFSTSIKGFFHDKVSSIDYTLTEITNEEVKPTFKLTPKSCIFKTNVDPDTKRKTLDIFIETEQNQSRGSEKAYFNAGGAKTALPEGYSASMVLSKNLLWNSYLEPQLEATQWKSITEETATEGVHISAKIDEKITVYKGESSWGFRPFEEELDLSQFPLKIVINKGKISMKWEIKYSLEYFHVWKLTKIGEYAEEGAVDLTVTCQKTSDLKFKTDGTENLHFEVGMTKDDITFEKKIIRSRGEYAQKYIDKAMEQFKNAFKPVNLKMDDLNVFALGNLLFHGAHKFKIDTINPFYVPRDLILFGQLEQ
ncbi:hypothetical protein [Bacteroides sp.]|uniref:hypothetical protein n=1 Tax=Bacteroides sp. TaxID=29523 RepID=UPI0026343041|nr:hypothetical protein [Bacteroides sp.]MDD3040805.1 hypothetical protein [Bacteroides sp.]